MGPDAMIFIFWMLSFKSTFSLSSFTFIKRLFSSSSLSAIRVVSSAYLRLLIFLLVILIPACHPSSPAFLVKYFAYQLNKQSDNIQTWHTPFPICKIVIFHLKINKLKKNTKKNVMGKLQEEKRKMSGGRETDHCGKTLFSKVFLG